MRIGELAAAARVNTQTVRYYERRGLLTPARRTAGGYREYDGEAATRLRFIKRAQELGFSLEEIEELLGFRVEGPESCDALQVRVQTKLQDVERKIRELRRLQDVLAGLATSCARRAATVDCPILEALSGEREGE